MFKLQIRNNYNVLNEFLNSLTHAFGTFLSILGLIFLIQKADFLKSNLHMIAYSIFGTSLIFLFFSSTMYHAFNFSKASNILRIIDHNSIYLLIAGSFTPYCLLALKGTSGWLMYSSIWTLAIGGIIHKSITMLKQKKPSKFSTLY